MDNINTLILRLKYALESLEEDKQEMIVDHVETYAAGVNVDSLDPIEEIKKEA